MKERHPKAIEKVRKSLKTLSEIWILETPEGLALDTRQK